AANLDLEADRLGVRAAERNVAVARSAFRPSLEAGILGVTIDDDRAEASFGQQAERTLQASLTASQLIFSDGASAGVEIEKALYEARQASYDTLTLDIAFEAGVSYLNLLRAETLQRVRRNNLDLTRSNLELAELRVEVGAANPSETFRWQSQIASDRQELIAAAAQVQQAQLAVNRLMHRDLETRFATVEIGLTSEFLIDQGDISGFIATPERFAVTRDFTVQEGLRNSPLLRTLGASLDAQSRQLKAARRAFYLPQVAAQLSLDHLLETAGAGSDVAVPAGSPSADDTSWSLSLSASLPLLTGGARRAQQLQAEEEVRRLETEVEAASERIAESIRAAMIATRASFLAIDLAEQAAAAASRSQDLVADAYARGNVSIIDLLDAQNAFLNAELAAANAVYDFFIDLLQVERAASRFYILDEPAERDAWLERLLAYFNERGLDVWRPTPFRQPDPDPASTAAGGVR
ncbi:MAG: TolC family protein, partial [Acidobacteriota bacterium]